MTKRIITQQDRDNAARFRAVWEKQKHALKMTQVELQKAMGYNSQSTISQFLHCKVALNTDAILGLSQILRVPPTDIDPTLQALTITAPSNVRHVKVPILARLSGTPPGPFEITEIVTTMTRQVYGVSVDTDGFEPFAKKGCTLILSQEEEPVTDDEVFIRFHTPVGTLHLLKRFISTDYSRGLAVVADLNTGNTEELPLDQIEVMDPVVSVERPMVNRPVRLRSKQASN